LWFCETRVTADDILQCFLFIDTSVEQAHSKLFLHSFAQLLFLWRGLCVSSPRRSRNTSWFSASSDY